MSWQESVCLHRTRPCGTNLYSRNFSWGTSLVGLSGRAGLDAGFGISYNSLIWTRQDSAIYFDTDGSNVSPGFRFGFPTIEPNFYDDFTAGFAYLMVTPSGARVRFDQTAVSDRYETADSSYAQLQTVGATNPNDPVENITITVTSTDGTQMFYEWKAGAFRCQKIKDRNGNYITVNHDEFGLLRSVTDTLGRIMTIEYDAELFPTAVKQTWKNNNGQGSDVTHTWATFTYSTNAPAINTDFGSLTVYGPANGTVIKNLQNITYADGSSTYFDYNSYGQVWKVRNIAADSQGHLLNYVRTNLQTPAGTQPDCPRFTETASWTENFNNNQEAVITNTLQSGQSYNVGGIQGTGTLVQVEMPNHPHGAISKTFYGNSDWKIGLPVATEDWATESGTSTRKRWTWTNWTQDNTNLTYLKNPRVIETKVGDATNTKRTTIDYRLLPDTTIADYGLVKMVKVYASDQSTILKQAETDYNLDTAYISRRIIGLPGESRVYGVENGVLSLAAKTTYNYDGEDFTQEINQIITPINHDTANFGASFITGRGNLTSVTRHDVTGQTAAVISKVRYDIAGSPVASIDALNRKTNISYADVFNDTTTSRNTFAYPTTLTDAAGNYSQVKHRYDIGANVWAKSPAPAGNTSGKETTREYDSIGRLLKQTLVNHGGAYTRYEYPTNGINSKIYSTIIDTNSNGADASDEVMSESWTDGAGRVRFSRTEHPNSAGGWSGAKVEYDKLGRVTRSTVPTEINSVNQADPSTWIPAGDDNRGLDGNSQPVWLWNSQEYDWKGRVTKEINTDGTDRLYSYEGCGCAGGQETTVKSESVPKDDQPTVNARRIQKVYQDILGRTWKTEVLNWDGLTPYTTTTQKFNGRDQVTETTQYQGTDNPNNTKQIVSMTYDGHGRMKTRHYPIENPGTYTEWAYNSDDSIQKVTDPRGAITNFIYEPERGLLTGISYQVPSGSSIAVTPTVSFSYDAVGNRTGMDTNGVSEIAYQYDSLSRLTSETINFDDLTDNLTVGYTYHLGGTLKTITDPNNLTISYTNDKAGRLTTVNGTSWGNNTTGNYADNIKYRAFGGIKQIDYKLPDETPQIKMNYDNRLRVNHSEVTTNKVSGGYLLKADFSYSADSRVQAKDDLLDNKWDRTMKYDYAGRLTFNQFGMGEGTDNTTKRVYEQTIAYDAFSMITSRGTTHWGAAGGFTETHTNGRITNNSNIQYDAAGNILDSNVNNSNPHEYQRSVFEAYGRLTVTHSSIKRRMGSLLNMVTETKNQTVFDGDGHPVIQKSGSHTYNSVTGTPPPTGWLPTGGGSYQVWSTVLGASLMTVSADGNSKQTNIYAGGAVIAKNSRLTENNQNTDAVVWMTADPVTGTKGTLSYNGTTGSAATEEIEPFGQQVSLFDPTLPEPPPEQNYPSEPLFGADNPQWQCEAGEAFWGGFSGMPFHCQSKVLQDLSRGLDEIYGFSNPHRPDNPTRIRGQVIGGVDSPVNVPNIPFMDSSAGKSPTNLALAKMLQSTAKPSDDKDKSKIVAEVNIPISFDKDELRWSSKSG